MTSATDGEPKGMEHLLPSVRPVVSQSSEERFLFARQDRWIDYPAATRIIDTLSDLLAAPVESRPRGFLVVARADNGKSSLLRRFEALNPPSSAENGQALMPVVGMSMPDEPTEPKIWLALLKVLRVPHEVTAPPKVHKAQAIEMLEATSCRILMVDEIHDLMQGSARQSSHALVLLKSMSNELLLRLVVAGTEKALRALETDDQITTRFEYDILPPWRPSRNLRSFLKGMESVLPLAEPSGLDGEAMVRAITARAGMTIGSIVKLLQAATVEAIRRGKERLDTALIERVNVGTLAMRNPTDKPDI